MRSDELPDDEPSRPRSGVLETRARESADPADERAPRRRSSRFRWAPPSNRVPPLLAALVIGAVVAVLPSTAFSDGGTEGPGAMSAAGPLGVGGGELPPPGESDGVVTAQKELTAPEAALRLDQLRASRDEREAPYGTTWVKPVEGGTLTTCFCMRWGEMHWGIDLAAPMGTPIYAIGDGVVLKSGPASGFGNAIYVQHENGDVTVYGHQYVNEVSAGDIVLAGQEIAKVGSEGQSTGPHLHLEIHAGGMDGDRIDPIPWLAARGVTVP